MLVLWDPVPSHSGIVMSAYLSSPPCLPGEQRWQDKLVLSDNTCLCYRSILLHYKTGTSATAGVLLSHLSSLKASHHWGNGKINTDSAANLCIYHCCYMGSFVCHRSSCPTEPLTGPINTHHSRRSSSLSEMVLFKYKYVYKGTSNNSSFCFSK